MKYIKIIKEILSWISVFALALIFSALINSQLFALATVKEVSMQDTLYENQKLVINRLAYKKNIPKTGDIIVFYRNREIGNFTEEFLRSLTQVFPASGTQKDNRDRLVKRVIGTPGDVVDIKDGHVYLNGEILDEPYAKGITYEGSMELPVTVGESQLFVMGDNREHSFDSRDFGLIDISHVEGKVVFRLYPFNKIGKVK
mgnify:CR=1 FL=1